MKAYMSDRTARQSTALYVAADGKAHWQPRKAEHEARAILAETEPEADGKSTGYPPLAWLAEVRSSDPRWTDVLVGEPTLAAYRDVLAESLRAFIDAPNPE